MKHPFKLTTILIIFFLISQVIGLYIISENIDLKKSAETGKPEFETLPGGVKRPEVSETYSFIYILAGILLGTGLLLLLIKFKLIFFWKFWFFLSVFICLTVALATFMGGLIASIVSVIFTYFKIVRRNLYIHNLTELFVYAGLAIVFVPILNRISVIALLILISLYDMYAVWKSKHMITLAKFQTKSKVFAGFFIPYRYRLPKKGGMSKKLKKDVQIEEMVIKPSKKLKIIQVKNAILGGGDIAFPLLFAGVMMKYIVITDFWINFLKILIIPIFATLALAYLFYKTEKDKFYPAMPFITAGCFIGYGLFLLL